MDTLLTCDEGGMYKLMFVPSKQNTVTDSSSSIVSLTNPMVLDMDRFLLDKEYVLCKHITKLSLESKNAKTNSILVSGRMLHHIAQRAMCNLKKALAILTTMAEVSAITPAGVEYMSGISETEVKLKLLQLMYVSLNGKEEDGDDDDMKVIDIAKNSKNNDGDGFASNFEGERPPGWFFTGWFAFCMFGPFVEESERIPILEPSGMVSDSRQENGRANLRKLAKEINDNERVNDNVNKRGVSIETKINIASLEMKSESINNQKKERMMMAVSGSLNAVQRDIERLEGRALRYCTEYNSNHQLWKDISVLEEKSKKLQDELTSMAYASPPKKRIKIIDASSPDQVEVVKVTDLNITNDERAAIPPVNIVSIDSTTTTGTSLSSDQISEAN